MLAADLPVAGYRALFVKIVNSVIGLHPAAGKVLFRKSFCVIEHAIYELIQIAGTIAVNIALSHSAVSNQRAGGRIVSVKQSTLLHPAEGSLHRIVCRKCAHGQQKNRYNREQHRPNYISCHNHLSLADRISINCRDIITQLLQKC